MALSVTLIAKNNIDAQDLYVPFEGDSCAKYHTHRKRLKRVIETDKFDSELDPSKFEVCDARTDRTCICTGQGRLGYARPGVEEGDIVCVFENEVVPFTVRRDVHKNAYALTGESYGDGLMHDEVLDIQQHSEMRLATVTLVCGSENRKGRAAVASALPDKFRRALKVRP